MVRYAEWREAIDPERPHERFDPAVRLAVASAAGIAGIACCAYGSIPAFIYTWRAIGDRQLERHVERLRDVPARHEQHACRLELISDGVVYGTDEGLVSFIDGSMLFEGRRTSFSVPRADADTRHLVGGGLSFRYEGPGGTYQAMVEATDKTRMADSYRSWLGQPVETEGAIVFPPFLPERSAWRRVGALDLAAVFAAVAGLVAGIELSLLGFTEVAAIVGVGTVAVAYAVGSSAKRLRRTLERLRALPTGKPTPMDR